MGGCVCVHGWVVGGWWVSGVWVGGVWVGGWCVGGGWADGWVGGVWVYLGHRLVIIVPPLMCQRVFTVSSVVPSVEGWSGGEEMRRGAGVRGRRRGDEERSRGRRKEERR